LASAFVGFAFLGDYKPVDDKPAKCKTAFDCPFVCAPPCDKQYCDPVTGICHCLCHKQ